MDRGKYQEHHANLNTLQAVQAKETVPMSNRVTDWAAAQRSPGRHGNGWGGHIRVPRKRRKGYPDTLLHYLKGRLKA